MLVKSVRKFLRGLVGLINAKVTQYLSESFVVLTNSVSLKGEGIIFVLKHLEDARNASSIGRAGFDNISSFRKSKKEEIKSRQKVLNVHLPLMIISWSLLRGSPEMGCFPCSSMYF